MWLMSATWVVSSFKRRTVWLIYLNEWGYKVPPVGLDVVNCVNRLDECCEWMNKLCCVCVVFFSVEGHEIGIELLSGCLSFISRKYPIAMATEILGKKKCVRIESEWNEWNGQRKMLVELVLMASPMKVCVELITRLICADLCWLWPLICQFVSVCQMEIFDWTFKVNKREIFQFV